MHRLHAAACRRVVFLVFAVFLCVAGWAHAQPFTDIGAPLVGVRQGSQAWGDYDNDGDLDLLVTGISSAGYVSKVYRNDGGGVFTDIAAGLTPVYESSVAWGDYDRDGDLDVLLTGRAVEGRVAKVYRNDGSTFTDIGAAMTGVQWGAVAWGDYDNDGDLDALITGDSGYPDLPTFHFGSTKLYRNDAGVFTDTGAALEGVYKSVVASGDYDDDGDLDIVLAGDSQSDWTARVYRNEGDGSFAHVASLTAVSGYAVGWGDYDNDGDLDIFLSGSLGGDQRKIYRNDGGGVFTDIMADLPGVRRAAWGDYDNDGDLDLLGDCFVRNDGGGVFVDLEWTGFSFPESAAVGDYDNDGDLDVVLAGLDPSSSLHITKLYRNDAPAVNAAPGTPSGLAASIGGSRVALSWAAASDTRTPAAGLSYNLRVGTSPGAGNVVSPMAGADGRRRIPALGNAQLGRTAILKSLAPGTYYWSVQAIDSSMIGSPFAAERSFTVASNGCTYSMTPTSRSVGVSGATGSVSVTAGAGCGWTAVSNDAWITFTTGTSRSGSGTVGYSVAANPAGPRTGSFTIAGWVFTVTQAGAPCSYSIEPTSATVEAAGGSGTVSVTAGGQCHWNAVTNAPEWLSVTAGATGSGTVVYSATENTGPERVGTLTIAGRTFTVTQAAACTYVLDPTSVIIGAAGGTGMVSVVVQDWCQWTATSNVPGWPHLPPWLTVVWGGSGSLGSGLVGYSVALASGVRSGTVTIGTATFTVNQIAVAAHELTHGSGELHSLAADPGPSAHVDRFLVAQAPYSSYEVIVDGASADVQPIDLARMNGYEITELQESAALGLGAGRSLRWRNAMPSPVLDQLIRVKSGGDCTTDCGADDDYRIRLYETTGTIARFNNAASQATVVVLQNPGDAVVSGSVHFWSGAGVLLASEDFTIAAKGTFVLNTASLPALSGTSGSITVAHDGGYGGLSGKAVSLEPATGYSFDSPLVWKPVR